MSFDSDDVDEMNISLSSAWIQPESRREHLLER
jgi:hypothetical protein